MTTDSKLGHNDENGFVYCNLCSWKNKYTSYEMIEAGLKQHLETVHKLRLLYAIEDDSGRRKDVPQ